jgi:hypothetical protein
MTLWATLFRGLKISSMLYLLRGFMSLDVKKGDKSGQWFHFTGGLELSDRSSQGQL